MSVEELRSYIIDLVHENVQLGIKLEECQKHVIELANKMRDAENTTDLTRKLDAQKLQTCAYRNEIQILTTQVHKLMVDLYVEKRITLALEKEINDMINAA